MSDRSLLDFIAHSGLFGWLSILASVALLFAGVLLFASQRRSRMAFLAFTLAALLPLGLGAVGTAVGHTLVNRFVEREDVSPAEEEAGRDQANSCVIVGGIGSLPLVMLGLAGLLLAYRRDQRVGEATG